MQFNLPCGHDALSLACLQLIVWTLSLACHFSGSLWEKENVIKMNTSLLLVCFPQCRWAVTLCVHSKPRLKGCHALFMQNGHWGSGMCHSCRARLPKSARGKEHSNSKTVIGKNRGRNSSEAISKINGVLKLNGDCPLSNWGAWKFTCINCWARQEKERFSRGWLLHFLIIKKDS